MIKPPCGHHCPNCGTVHSRCEKYYQFKQAIEQQNEMIREKKRREYDLLKFKLDSVAKTTGKSAIYQR